LRKLNKKYAPDFTGDVESPEHTRQGEMLSNGRTVAWKRGYDFDQSMLKDLAVKKKELTKLSGGIKMLNIGRLDAILDYKSSFVPATKTAGLDLANFTLSVAQHGSKLFVVFSNSDNAKHLIKVFDERMGELANSGKIETIYKKWGFGPEKFGYISIKKMGNVSN